MNDKKYEEMLRQVMIETGWTLEGLNMLRDVVKEGGSKVRVEVVAAPVLKAFDMLVWTRFTQENERAFVRTQIDKAKEAVAFISANFPKEP